MQWQSRYGDEKRPHHNLHTAFEDLTNIAAYDLTFYSLYRKSDDLNAFENLVNLFGRKYALIAYLLFLKDRTRYMPIAPKYFDQAFYLLGVDFSTYYKCSWENYLTFNRILSELKVLLADKLEGEVSLLDAHSFAWIISRTIDDNGLSKNTSEYLELSVNQRETVVKARIGQGKFRDELVNYWRVCAVTGCQELSLLRASHIKPWAMCDVKESIDPFNGLLLSPSFDAAFDEGFITFDNAGIMVISAFLRESDAKVLGISPLLSLSQIDPQHQRYLNYHREYIFRKS
ncbi:HNH endonuclease [Nostoc sp. FACHB-152]|uniref:HNH endonuclease n=1 Tax=unclassified Nostoc TaxID=2593658 RepID=UPI00168845B3|nr:MULTISPECIES: HNH endonuclease [unclassified Nostoc]MBD2445818.1 HNH endonuclease [Nostoc sp. FACHB-152]MBD2468007.1 HNH endonuclease [Nostoc sp. FACHB-145]